MIITKTIKIKINKGNIPRLKKFIELSNIKIGDEIDLPIKYISKHSKEKVLVKCDICGCEKIISYCSYISSTKDENDIYVCLGKCSNIKREKTNMMLYGVKNCFQNEKVKEKSKKTMKSKYGYEFNMQCQEFLNKRKETYLKNWGVDNPTKNETLKKQISDKISKTKLLKIKNKYNNITIINNKDVYTIIGKCNHVFEINKSTFYQRISHGIEICTICNPLISNTSNSENKLLDFIKENYTGEVIENSRNIINPYEIDIYIPKLNIAFEFNGIFWHSEFYKGRNYHLIKTKLCEEKGILLIHVWEDDWNFKQEIVKSIILNKLGKTPNKIYAKRCEIKEINDNKLIVGFLNKNHIQSYIDSDIKIGLFYNKELVSVMCFRFFNQKENKFELIRFCSKLNTNVIGGASKLFNYFIETYNPKEIKTYTDRSYFNGKLYEKIGFKFKYKTEPECCYIIDGIRKHNCDLIKNENKHKKETVLENSMNKIFNSGKLMYFYQKSASL